jgi:copper(I)-binding protein
MKSRFLLAGLTLTLSLLAPPVRSDADAVARLVDVHVTAAAPHELAAIEAVITNTTDLPLTLVSISTSKTSRGMFHFSFNMCQPGTSMIRIPSLIVPVHRSVTLSTKGAGAMVAAKGTALKVGTPIAISITAIRGTHRFVLHANGDVIARPKGLKRSYGGTVGAQ